MARRKREPAPPPTYEVMLRWARWDVWVNGGITIGYLLWVGWQFTLRSGDSPSWAWIGLAIGVVFLLWFARGTRRAFKRYVALKEWGGGDQAQRLP